MDDPTTWAELIGDQTVGNLLDVHPAFSESQSDSDNGLVVPHHTHKRIRGDLGLKRRAPQCDDLLSQALYESDDNSACITDDEDTPRTPDSHLIAFQDGRHIVVTEDSLSLPHSDFQRYLDSLAAGPAEQAAISRLRRKQQARRPIRARPAQRTEGMRDMMVELMDALERCADDHLSALGPARMQAFLTDVRRSLTMQCHLLEKA